MCFYYTLYRNNIAKKKWLELDRSIDNTKIEFQKLQEQVEITSKLNKSIINKSWDEHPENSNNSSNVPDIWLQEHKYCLCVAKLNRDAEELRRNEKKFYDKFKG